MLLLWLGIVLVLSKLLGGKFSGLARLELVGGGWLALALVMQLAGLWLVGGKFPELRAGLVIGGFGVLLALGWYNRKLPGMPIILAGIFLNFLVITANGGVMPITAEVLATIGRSSDVVVTDGSTTPSVSVSKTALSAQPNLLFLGDVIVVPLPGRFKSAISLGDILIGLGIAVLSIDKMGLGQHRRRLRAKAN